MDVSVTTMPVNESPARQPCVPAWLPPRLRRLASPLQATYSPAFDCGAALLWFAFVILHVTLAGGDYRGVLLTSLVLLIVGNGFIAYAWRHGGRFVRAMCLGTLAPTLFIISELVYRAPYAWPSLRAWLR